MAVEDYQGLEGYHRMVRELRISVAREFPEKAHDIFIVDMAADRAGQIAEAARQLGMTPEELMARGRQQDTSTPPRGFPDIQDGEAYPVTRADGTTAWVIFSWPPEVYAQDPERLTPDNILEMSKVILHEVGHATGVGTMQRSSGPAVDDAVADNVREESAAEVFALAALTDNGIAPEKSDYLCAMYDARKYDPKHGERMDRYDPSEEFRHLRDTHLAGGPRRPFTSYDEITGLRETYNATRAAFPQTPETRREGLEAVAYQRSLLFAVEQLRREGRSEEEIAQWVIDRQRYIQDGAQVESGRAYLENPTGDYRPAQPATGTYPQSVGMAWLAAIDHPNDTASVLYGQWMVMGMEELVSEGLYAGYDPAARDFSLPGPVNDPRWRPVAELMAGGASPQAVRDAIRQVDVTERGMRTIDGLRRDSQNNGLRDLGNDGIIDNGDVQSWLRQNGISPEMANRFNYSDGVNMDELSMLQRASNNARDQRER